jgi:hypothetical protein
MASSSVATVYAVVVVFDARVVQVIEDGGTAHRLADQREQRQYRFFVGGSASNSASSLGSVMRGSA